MIPPERGFKREANAQSTPVSTMEKVVRYTEKDDLLLYITAGFGIFMPAIMYFIYRTIHSKYHQYQQEKRKMTKMKKRSAKSERARTVTIFYCSSSDTVKRIAYNLAEEIDNFDPVVRKLTPSELAGARKSKSALILLIETGDGTSTQQELSEFLDWLDELRYGHRQKGYMREVNFIVYGVSTSEESEDRNKDLDILQRRIESLQGRPMAAPKIMTVNEKNKDWKKRLREFSTELTTFLTQFQYGAFDEQQISDISSSGFESEIDEDRSD